MYQVNDIMTERLVAVGPDASIDHVISLLLEHGVSGLPVIDADGKLLGVISELDIIDLVYEADIEASTVGDHMTRDVRVVNAGASLDDAARLFCTETVRRFPVVSEGRLVGILSRRDPIRFVRDVRKKTAGQRPSHAAAATHDG